MWIMRSRDVGQTEMTLSSVQGPGKGCYLLRILERRLIHSSDFSLLHYVVSNVRIVLAPNVRLLADFDKLEMRSSFDYEQAVRRNKIGSLSSQNDALEYKSWQCLLQSLAGRQNCNKAAMSNVAQPLLWSLMTTTNQGWEICFCSLSSPTHDPNADKPYHSFASTLCLYQVKQRSSIVKPKLMTHRHHHRSRHHRWAISSYVSAKELTVPCSIVAIFWGWSL